MRAVLLALTLFAIVALLFADNCRDTTKRLATRRAVRKSCENNEKPAGQDTWLAVVDLESGKIESSTDCPLRSFKYARLSNGKSIMDRIRERSVGGGGWLDMEIGSPLRVYSTYVLAIDSDRARIAAQPDNSYNSTWETLEAGINPRSA